MFNKSIIAIAVAVGFAGTAHAQDNKTYGWQNKVNHVINANIESPVDQAGRSRYIVQLLEEPAAVHAAKLMDNARKSSKSSLMGTQSQTPVNKVASVLKTAELQSYRQQIARYQNDVKTAASQVLGRELQSQLSFNLAFNGMVLDLTPDEASQLLAVPRVVRVIKEIPTAIHTDVGPQHIGAGNIWDGSATGVSAKGEGIIIGILDTGINTDNRAFSAKGDDGYNVINPLGSGNYLGDCAADASLCNDKLIGIYSYKEITDTYGGIRPANGEDYQGHGSHTASTSAGNVLTDVPVLIPGIGAQVSDGTPSGTAFPKISGVAPHANIIAYQVCGLTGCSPSLTIASVEHAIEDGVDVLNYSIGPNGGVQSNPWDDPAQAAFLAAREAGIVVATAAGNDGPSASTVGNNSPWAIVVAAATHERIWSHELTGSGAGGEIFPAVEGQSDVFTTNGIANTLLTETEVVYAGDYQDMYGNNLKLCDQALSSRDPVRTALMGKVVICDRGVIPLVDKVSNMYMAAGVVIINTADSNQNMANARYSLPSMLLNQADGESLLSWVKNTDTPKVSIGAATAKYDAAGADILAEFSSRGPYYPVPELMVPHIAAPGVDIYAAYADEQPFTEAYAASPSDFSFLSGTSMATPHVAGAAALMRQLHPDWTPAEIQSAMMLTANSAVRKEDGVTPAGIFDTGSGAIQIDKAAQAGLVMDVTIDAYKAADPSQGGDVRQLNMPLLTDAKCAYSCTWQRTFRATKTGNWSIETQGAVDGLSLTASPTSFSMTEGESVTVNFTANASLRIGENWHFLRMNLVPSDSSPILSMPVAIKPLLAEVPAVMSQDYFWSKGDLVLPGLRFRYPEDLLLSVQPLERATTYNLDISADSDNNSPFDDVTDGTALQLINVPEGASDLRVIVGESSAKDIDLFIGLDSNHNGIPEPVELVLACATSANVGEGCRFNAGAGSYWVLAHNFEGSGADTDTVRLDVLMKPNTDTLQAFVGLGDSNVQPYETTTANLNWVGDMQEGVYYGQMEVFDRTSASTTRVLGKTNLVVNRVAPTTRVDVVNAELGHGQQAMLNVTLPGNPTPEPLSYTLMLDSNANLAVTEFVSTTAKTSSDVDDEAKLSHDDSNMTVTLESGAESQNLSVSLSQITPESGEFDTNWSLTSSKEGFEVQQGQLLLTNSNQAPSLTVPSQLTGSMGTQVTLNLVAEDTNDDELTYTLVQTSGPAVTIEHDGNGQATLTLPQVDKDYTATFSASVSDGELTQSSDVSLQILHTEENSGGGALGWGVLLLGLFGLRRKMMR